MRNMTWLALILLAPGCVRHIYPFNGKIRDYQSDNYADEASQRSSGSLWSNSTQGVFEDARANRVGDILTVAIDERADASRDAATQTGRKSSVDAGLSSFLVAMSRLNAQYPNLNPASLLSASSSSEFEGAGSTSRSGTLTATLPVRVKKRLPNGDFFVEGNKVVLINDEESYLYLSGVVRPIDIQPDNSVSSSVLADVELEFTGRGVLSERQSPGFLARALDYIWPF